MSLNEVHPKVKKALKKLSELAGFMDGEPAADFSSEFEDEHGYPFKLSNREFWEQQLDL